MPTTPTWAEVIKTSIQRALLELHSAMPGEVISYDNATQTAEVKPLLKWQKFLPGRALKQVFDLPPLADVLVCHPRAGDYAMHMPLSSGDLVLIVFCDRSISSWRGQSSPTQTSDPGTYDPLPLSGAIAVPLMAHDSAPVDFGSSSSIRIGSNGGSFDFIAWASEVDDRLSTIQTTFDTHIHTTTATIGATATPGVIAPTATPVGALATVANSDVEVS